MEKYRDVLTITISVITKTYLVYAAVLMCVLIFSFIIKKKKLRNTMLVLILCTLIAYAILVVPRFLDLHNDSFVKVENSTLIKDEMTTDSTNIIFYGSAYIVSSDGKSIQVSGTDFFEVPPYVQYEQYYGDIVYAKYSRQLITMENARYTGQ